MNDYLEEEYYDYLEKDRFNMVKARLAEMKESGWEIPHMVACIYGLYQDYIISEEQEKTLYEIADPDEQYNNCSKYYNDMDYDNPLLEALT